MTNETKPTTPDFFAIAKLLWPEKDEDTPSINKGKETIERLYSSPAALEKMGLVKDESVKEQISKRVRGMKIHCRQLKNGWIKMDKEIFYVKRRLGECQAELAEAKRKLEEAQYLNAEYEKGLEFIKSKYQKVKQIAKDGFLAIRELVK